MTQRRRLAYMAVVALGLALPLLLVWSVRYPPQVDAPNHVARHYLESLYLRGEPLPPGYEIAYRILPNLAADLVLPPLMVVFDPVAAWKIFLSLALMLYWAGPAVFILQEGGYRPPAWLAAALLLPFVLSSAFFWGFLNYYTSVGAAFLVAAHLRRLDRRGEVDATGLIVQTAMAALLYLGHLAAVFIYGVLAGCTALARLWTLRRAGRGWVACLRRAALLCVPLLSPAVLHLVYSATAGSSQILRWDEPTRKLLMLAMPFRGYSMVMDALVAAFWAAALLAFFWPALRAPRGGTAALPVGVFLGLYLAMPEQWGMTFAVDTRLVPALLVCTLAWLGTLPAARWSWAGVGLLGAALILRSGDVWQAWQRLDRRLQEAARSFEHLKFQARVLPVILTPAVLKENAEQSFVSLAVITQHAYVPTLFAARDQQPLRLTAGTKLATPFVHFPAGTIEDGVFTIASEADAAEYDYLWVFNPNRLELRLPPSWERTFSGERVSLWRVHPDAGATAPSTAAKSAAGHAGTADVPFGPLREPF